MSARDWKPISQIDYSRVSKVKAQYHVAIQSVAATGRRFLPETKGDTNASLYWVPGLSRIASRWVKGNIRFRSSLSFLDFSIYLVDDRVNTISSFSIKDKTHRSIMLWLEEQIGKLGLSSSQLTLNLPYQLPDYPQLEGETFNLVDELATEELRNYYHNSYHSLRALRSELDWSEEIIIWPHHFDMAISIILKDSGDPETNTLVTLGMMPGNDQHEQPYFYVSTWPNVHTSALQYSGPGKLVEDDWTGAILTPEELANFKVEEQENMLTQFYKSCYHLLVKSLIK